MATLKLKKSPTAAGTAPAAPSAHRPPLRSTGMRQRPTLAQAQAHRAERAQERPPERAQGYNPYREPEPGSRGDRGERGERAYGKAPKPSYGQAGRQERNEPRQDRNDRHAPPPSRDPRRAAPTGPLSSPPALKTKRPPLAPAKPTPVGTVASAGPRPNTRPAEQRPQPLGITTVAGERLSKRMTALGLASRREADEWIEAGWVRVNGELAVLGQRVTANDHISIDPAAHRQQAQRVTILLNKPVGVVSGQAEEGYEPAVALIRPDNQWKEDKSGLRWHPGHLRHLAPAGRLDIDSVGLLVLTQDGRIARQLIGDESQVEKEYLVRVEYTRGERLPDSDLALLNHGLSLDEQPLKPCKVSWQNEDQLRFVLREGRKRQIRRMCEAVGLKVVGLKRVRIGSVVLGHLPPGQWRYLRRDEFFA